MQEINSNNIEIENYIFTILDNNNVFNEEQNLLHEALNINLIYDFISSIKNSWYMLSKYFLTETAYTPVATELISSFKKSYEIVERLTTSKDFITRNKELIIPFNLCTIAEEYITHLDLLTNSFIQKEITYQLLQEKWAFSCQFKTDISDLTDVKDNNIAVEAVKIMWRDSLKKIVEICDVTE